MEHDEIILIKHLHNLQTFHVDKNLKNNLSTLDKCLLREQEQLISDTIKNNMKRSNNNDNHSHR